MQVTSVCFPDHWKTGATKREIDMARQGSRRSTAAKAAAAVEAIGAELPSDGKSDVTYASLCQEVGRLVKENDELLDELEAERHRSDKLEAVNKDVTNRLSSAIASIKSVLSARS